MRSLAVTIVGICALLTGGCDNAVTSKPTTEEIKPAIYIYLLNEYSNLKNVSVAKLENIRVGDYDKHFKAWHVYADYSVTAQDGENSCTYNGGQSDAATCMARYTDGWVECFKPEIFAKFEKEMDAKMQQELDRMFQ